MAREIKEICLSLSGGGARGAYHLGVLQYLDEQNIKIKAISATSIGSIIGASYASGVSPKEQLEILKSSEIKSMFSFNWFKKSIFKINIKAKILDKLIKFKNLNELKIPLYISAVDLYTGSEKSFDSGDIKTLCKASCALFPIFETVKYEDMLLADGGIINYMPISELFKYKYPIIGVDLHPVSYEKIESSIFSTFKRASFLLIYGQNNDSKSTFDFLISSKEIRKYSIFSFKNFDKLFELGYKEAKLTLA